MTTLLVMVAVGLGSYAFRVVPVALLRGAALSQGQERLIRDAGLAAVTALVVTSTRHAATGSAAWPTLGAVAAALAVAAGKNKPSTARLMVVGVAVYAAVFAAAHRLG
jgi:branched-subunit amino acid transport protein